MDGDEISPEDFHAPNSGWQDAIKKENARRRVQSVVVQPRQNQPGTTGLAAKRAARAKKPRRLPKLPEDDVRVVLRLRGGIQLKPGDCVTLQRSIQLSANVTGGMAARDTSRLNEQKTRFLLAPRVPKSPRATVNSRSTRTERRNGTSPPTSFLPITPNEASFKAYRRKTPSKTFSRISFTAETPPYCMHAAWDAPTPSWFSSSATVYPFGGDVCPNPTDHRCNACYALNPAAEKRTPFQPNSSDFPPLPPASRSRSRTPAKRQNPRIPSRSRSRKPAREGKDKTANNSRNSDSSDLRRMVTQLRDENRWLLDRLERTEQECTNLRQQLQAGATLPTPDPEATSPPASARWRHDPNLLHLREREALRPSPFNRKTTEPLPKCCRTQRGSPVSPHNSTASGRHRLTRTNTMRKSKTYIVWQWNCRGYGKKRGHLQQHINSLPAEDGPDVIALQESSRLAKLSGYVTFGCDNSEKTQVTSLVKRNVPVILHDRGISTIDHILIEIIAPKKADTRSLFGLNIYSGPRSKHKFAKLFRAVLDMARKQPLLVVGDFNAPHPAWGRNLWTDTHESGLSLLPNPDQPTRRGDIRQNDTTPDLAFTKRVKEVIWTNTGEDLGSDHFVVRIDATAGPTQRRGKPCTVVEWDKFRSLLEEEHVDDIRDIDLWSDWIRTTADYASKVIPEDGGFDAADSRLIHLWEAKTHLETRLLTQKNRLLRRRIAQLSRTIEKHAEHICQQQWQDLCDSFGGQPNVPKTWNIIRHLLDPEGNKAAQHNRMCEIVRRSGKSEEDPIDLVRQRYLGDTKSRSPTIYAGSPNEVLDADFTTFEVTAAVRDLKTKSAPGPDGIPPAWKMARVVMIPKPGKKSSIDALRPISLTSCAGKLMEHVVLNRLNRFMKNRAPYPHTMVGFRPHLSTQDVIARHAAVLGLDLTKAFDNIKHNAVLVSLEQLGVGAQTYPYIQDFLTNRTARISIGGATSEEIPMGDRSTPQGSVLSPFVFSTAMLGLPERLEVIGGLQHSIYTDDIKLWVAGGSDGQIQDTLQAAINAVEDYVTPRGLACSPQKSELPLLKPLYSRRVRISAVKSIGVLGLRIQADDNYYEAINWLKATTYQITRLISRISGRRFGLKESNLVRLVRAFVVSKMAYVLPFLRLEVAEKTKLDCLIRKSYKRALGLPDSTSNDRFAALGLHNTVDEIVEAQRLSQMERLARSATGRHILRSLGIRCDSQTGPKCAVPTQVLTALLIQPIPKYMHSIHHEGRRSARVRDLRSLLSKERDDYYVDAADYGTGKMVSAVIDAGGSLVAIALALQTYKAHFVVSDSQRAIRQFAKGRVSPQAARILRGFAPATSPINLIWTPAHSSLPGNEEAHSAARGLIGRAGLTLAPSTTSLAGRDGLVTFRDVLDYYAGDLARYPPAHAALDKASTMNSYPNPSTLHKWYPDRYSSKYKLYGAKANLRHMLPPHRRSKKPLSDGPRTPPRSRGSKPPSEENDRGRRPLAGAADTDRLTLHLGK
ncbi:hypothetical protein HPB47_004234 [Ixodes persulcatus]|uniref:Uncharacterized protein n=1 Tax=Ixodes persulcatus TaxID=34615 RepID=A0AC60PGG7_IXOPE|nr:hypothetical protein HPB47_004234 [Ixodes persulcatus]